MLSTCGFCKSRLFKVQEQEPSGSRFKLLFVQCSQCGHPIGVKEYHNIGALIDGLEKKVDRLLDQVDQINHRVNQISYKVKA